MTQEFMAQPYTLSSTFNETGNIGQDKTCAIATPGLPYLHNTQIRRQRRKRIVGNFGVRRRDDRKKGGFTSIWIADQSNVCNQSQFKGEPTFFSRLAFLSLFGSLMSCRCKVDVAQTSSPTTCHHDTLFG